MYLATKILSHKVKNWSDVNSAPTNINCTLKALNVTVYIQMYLKEHIKLAFSFCFLARYFGTVWPKLD